MPPSQQLGTTAGKVSNWEQGWGRPGVGHCPPSSWAGVETCNSLPFLGHRPWGLGTLGTQGRWGTNKGQCWGWELLHACPCLGTGSHLPPPPACLSNQQQLNQSLWARQQCPTGSQQEGSLTMGTAFLPGVRWELALGIHRTTRPPK